MERDGIQGGVGGGRGGVGAEGDYFFWAHATPPSGGGAVNVGGRLFNFLFFSDLVSDGWRDRWDDVCRRS